MFPEARGRARFRKKNFACGGKSVESFLGCTSFSTFFFHFNFLFHFGSCSSCNLWGEGMEEKIKNCVETNFKMLVKEKVHSG